MAEIVENRRRETSYGATATAKTKAAQTAALIADYTPQSTFSSLYSQHGPIMTPEEASGPLHMHPSTIRRLCAQGKLPGVKCGKVWRLPTSKLANFIDGVL